MPFVVVSSVPLAFFASLPFLSFRPSPSFAIFLFLGVAVTHRGDDVRPPTGAYFLGAYLGVEILVVGPSSSAQYACFLGTMHFLFSFLSVDLLSLSLSISILPLLLFPCYPNLKMKRAMY